MQLHSPWIDFGGFAVEFHGILDSRFSNHERPAMPLTRRSFLSLLAGAPFLERIRPAPPAFPWVDLAKPNRSGVIAGITPSTEVFWRSSQAHHQADVAVRVIAVAEQEIRKALERNRAFLEQEVFKKTEHRAEVNRHGP